MVCALTGIERCPDWRRVLDTDLALLQRHAGLLDVTILPVATTVTVRAREMGGDAGHVLRLESGIVDLHEMLRAAAVAAHTAAVARSAVIARTRSTIAATIEELRADDGASVRAERARLVQQASAPADPGGRARSDLQRARLELLQEVAASVRATSTAVRDAVDADPVRAYEAFDGAVRNLSERVSAIVAARLGEKESARPGEPGTAPLRTPAPMAPVTETVEDRLTVVLGASAGAGLGRLLAFPFEAVPAAHLATVPITVAGGLGAGVVARAGPPTARRTRPRAALGDRRTHRDPLRPGHVGARPDRRRRGSRRRVRRGWTHRPGGGPARPCHRARRGTAPPPRGAQRPDRGVPTGPGRPRTAEPIPAGGTEGGAGASNPVRTRKHTGTDRSRRHRWWRAT
ncbi:hypothetical protein F8M49_29205 [Rhodococcus zopfii]|uniref:Uncharacterized protein n=1 Tax=Rhodococcus zopfii TaxID=43772 RepID=A0ABU3WX34_9NOCA|nr:hypothetical protein [Rhodococcus zopfii]